MSKSNNMEVIVWMICIPTVVFSQYSATFIFNNPV